MITSLAVERIAFTCRHCGKEWSSDYDVAHYEEPDGEVFEYFSLEGQPVPCPYPAGSVLCPACGQPATAARLVACRELPLPPGDSDTPRRHLADPEATLAERRKAPPLQASQPHTPTRHT